MRIVMVANQSNIALALTGAAGIVNVHVGLVGDTRHSGGPDVHLVNRPACMSGSAINVIVEL